MNARTIALSLLVGLAALTAGCEGEETAQDGQPPSGEVQIEKRTQASCRIPNFRGCAAGYTAFLCSVPHNVCLGFPSCVNANTFAYYQQICADRGGLFLPY